MGEHIVKSSVSVKSANVGQFERVMDGHISVTHVHTTKWALVDVYRVSTLLIPAHCYYPMFYSLFGQCCL